MIYQISHAFLYNSETKKRSCYERLITTLMHTSIGMIHESSGIFLVILHRLYSSAFRDPLQASPFSHSSPPIEEYSHTQQSSIL